MRQRDNAHDPLRELRLCSALSNGSFYDFLLPSSWMQTERGHHLGKLTVDTGLTCNAVMHLRAHVMGRFK